MGSAVMQATTTGTSDGIYMGSVPARLPHGHRAPVLALVTACLNCLPQLPASTACLNCLPQLPASHALSTL